MCDVFLVDILDRSLVQIDHRSHSSITSRCLYHGVLVIVQVRGEVGGSFIIALVWARHFIN